MSRKTKYDGEPYRVVSALGQEKWNVYAQDDSQQERYIGRVLKEGDLFCVEKAYTDERLEERTEEFEEAIQVLYTDCKTSGYLTQGHENYLGQAGRNRA